MSLTVYGIPTCGTVRKARTWLDDNRVAYQFVDLREHPPDADTLKRWVEVFGAKALRNTSGGAYRALGPEKATWTDAQWVRAFADEPMLIKRPVIIRDGVPVQVGFRGSDDDLRARLCA